MCKKLCIAVGAVIVGLVAVMAVPSAGTLAKTKWTNFTSWMERQVSPEDQLRNLNAEIDKIDKDIQKHLKTLARQEVAYEKLESDFTGMKEQQAKLREEITALDKALDTKEIKVSYNGRNYPKSELALRLESLVSTYEVRKAEIKTKDQLLSSKRQALELAHQQIAEMKEQKDKLRVKAAELERRIEMVKVKQVDCPLEVNDTQVNKCNVLADKLDRLLSEQEKTTELYHKYGYDKKSVNVKETKSVDEVRQAAKKALADDEDTKVVEQK